MVYKHFRVVIVTRIILIFLSLALLGYVTINTSLYGTITILALIVIYQTFSLIRYVERTNLELTRFFESIRYSDFSQSFSSRHMGKSFAQLSTAFNQVIKKFQTARAEKEAHFRYLQTVVQHVGIGLISFLPDGTVGLINSAAKKIFAIPHLHNIDELDRVDPQILKGIRKIKPGEKALIKLVVNNDQVQLAVSSTKFQLQESRYTLISLQNIGQELEENELESWQKLIRVLTHEIMNSVTPISSLASTINKMLSSESGDPKKYNEEIDDIKNALETIQKRSDSLINFVDTYRKLTKLPRPDFKIFKISDNFNQISQLMHTRVEEKHIEFSAKIIPESLEVTADPDMIEQVLINLLINAIQAVENQPNAKIEMKAWQDSRNRIIVEVSDNGPGIPDDVIEKIFIPFFTTKQDGSGIGLSLSRQIMRLHGGAINVSSIPDTKTVFTLRF